MMDSGPQGPPDEYDFDSSDEEDVRNTIGNIPVQWYNSFAHIGYDTSGRPIMRPDFAEGQGDSIDEFLKRVDTGNGEMNLEWRTVRDPQTGQCVILSDHDLEFVTRMAAGKGVLGDEGSKPFEEWNEWFSKDVMQMPVTAHPPQKRSFIPSILDRRRTAAIARLNVLRVVSKPTAAAFAYALYKNIGGEHDVLNADLAGGTFHVPILTEEDGMFEVRLTAGTHVDGRDFCRS
ncbi:unnamed protein product [Calicophoron daubneyi]|uniref:BOP1 N-terminal domain-containing protein n=1 Tax=Calicophoron daubneyi TaxID=300641 RepID=A0AAV2TV72_CALDB